MEVKNVAIVGAGIMGSGIDQVSAMSGYSVTLTDISASQLDKAKRFIDLGLSKLVQKGKLVSEKVESILSRIKTSDLLDESVRNADLVIEATFENLELKQKIFKDLGKFCKPSAILGSNTSALPITEIASVTNSCNRLNWGIHLAPASSCYRVEYKDNLTNDAFILKTDRKFH